jgi:uncharacterized membrane protein
MNKVILEIESEFKKLLKSPLKAVVLSALHSFLIKNQGATQVTADAYLIGIVDTLVAELVSVLPIYLKPEAIMVEPFVENLFKASIPTIVDELYAQAEAKV